jgi:hypothetical protein
MTTENQNTQQEKNLPAPAPLDNPGAINPVMMQSSTVKTHGATEISDSVFWAGHAIGLTLLVIATVWIFAAKGPTRKDAIKSLLEDANKKNPKTV